MRIQTKLALFFFGVILIPLVLTQVFFITELYHSLYETSTTDLENLAVSTGKEIERLVEMGKHNIIILSHNPVLQSENVTKFEKLQQLQIAQDFHKIFDDITLIDTEGHVVTSTTYSYRGEWSSNAWYKKALNGSVVVSDAHVVLDPWKVVLVYFSPVRSENGSVIGVVAGQIDFKQIWDVLNSYTIGETGFVYLIDNNGKILSHPDEDLIFSEFMYPQLLPMIENNLLGTTEYLDEHGNNMICGYASILQGTVYENNDDFWGVIATQQSEEVFSSLLMFRDQITLFIISIGTIFIIMGVVFSLKITKPIQKLEEGAKRVSAGDFEYHVDVKSGDELENLADAFNKMTDNLKISHDKLKQRTVEIENLLRQKDEFINQLGHDLKNPLVPILNVLPIAMEKTDDPEMKRLLEIISDRVTYIKQLIVNTLKLAKLKSTYGELTFQKISLFDLIDKVIKGNELIAGEKKIKIENKVDKNIFVHADKLQLEEVLQNLVSNAIKFTDQGTITIAAEKENDVIKISVKDTGIGMTEEQIERAFDEFYKADESRHDLGSSGLGLSICKRIVEKHGGRIWVESPGLGKGTTFYFTIPLSPDN